MNAEVNLFPDYAEELFTPKRYKVLYGGRGSAKSYSVARALLALGYTQKIRVLCAREFQNSINESVHKLLQQEAQVMGLEQYYSVTRDSITGGNGTEFIFKGVKQNADSIKSMVGLTHLWVEEAHTISQRSWDILIPTIRAPGSEIWVTFNPENDDDPTYKMFVDKSGQPLLRDDAYIKRVSYRDNPWFPDVLEKERAHLSDVNPGLAQHIWEGACRTESEAQIMRGKWEVRNFEPQAHYEGPYFGADWGFSRDPLCIVKVFIDYQNSELLIRQAKFRVGVDFDKIPEFFDEVSGARAHTIRADNSRPETISHISQKGFDIIAADKWTGSVEDGIDWIRGFRRVVIHPECEEMIEEAKYYSFKTDRLTGDVLRDIVDTFNHGWDAVRYACDPMIQSTGPTGFDVL